MAYEPDESIDDISLQLQAEKAQADATNNQNQNNQPPAGNPGDPTGDQTGETAANPPGAAPMTVVVPDPAATPPAATKEWYDEDPAETAAAQPGAAATQQPAQTQTQPADPVYEKYKSVLVDPQVQFLLDQRLAGKSLMDVQKEITIIDYDKMSPADLLKAKMERYGADPADIIEAVEIFNQKKVHEQNEEIEGTRERLKQAQEAKMKSLNQIAQQSQEQAIQQQQRINSEIQSTIESLKGKDFYGRVISDDAINKALPMVMNGVPGWTKADGSPNIQQIFEDIIFLNERSAIVRENVKRATAAGARAVATEIVNGSKNLVSQTGSATHAATSIEEEAARMEAEDEKRYGRTG